MNAMELLDIIGTARDSYVAEAGKIRSGEMRPRRGGLSINRTVLIAAVIALLLLLVGCVAYMLSLNDLVLGQEKHQDSLTGETETWNMLSLQGFAGSDNYLAAREWYEFRETHTAPYSDFDAPEGYEAYGCYSREMKDKIDEICRKYGLKLLGGSTVVNAVDSIFRAVQIDGITDGSEAAEVSLEGGYFYRGGTFLIDGETTLIGENNPWAYPVSYQFRCVMKDVFDNVYLNIGDVDSYEQWTYIMEDGTELLLALSGEKALIIADREDFFVTVNILNPRVGDILTGEHTMDRAALEAVAETFDFSFAPRKASEEDIAAAEKSMEEEWEKIAEAYKEKIHLYKELGYDTRVKFQMENSATPDQLGFAMMDLDGNGVEELLVGENGYIRAIYTAKDGGAQHLLPLGAAYADEFITYNWIGAGAATTPTYIYLCENNSLVYVYDSVNEFVAYHFARLEGNQLVWKEFLQYNPDYDADSPWRWGTEFTHTESITEEAFNRILDSYVRVPVDMIPISEYVLTDDSPSGIGEPDPVYSSYEEFIQARKNGDDDRGDMDYTLIDLDMDGQNELFWIEGAWKGIFTMENGQVKLVVNGEDLMLCEGNMIALTHHYLDGNMACCYYKVENGNAVLVDYLRCDAELNPSNPWFRSSDASGQDVSLEAISQAEYDAIRAKYTPEEMAARVKAYLEQSENPERLGYAFLDIDGNGVEELLIGMDGYCTMIYTEEEGTTEQYTGAAAYSYPCEGQIIAVVTDNDYCFYRIQGSTMERETRIRYAPGDPDAPWRRYTTWRDYEAITEEEFYEILNSYARIPVEMLPLTEFPLEEEVVWDPNRSSGFTGKYGNYQDMVRVKLTNPEDQWYRWCYALYDIDGNGQEELIWQEDGSRRYAYTMTSGGLNLLESGDEITVCENGILAVVSHYGMENKTYCYYRIDGDRAVLVEYLRYDVDADPENPWLRSSDNSGQDISLQAISREEAERIISSYVPVGLEMKLITEYPLR